MKEEALLISLTKLCTEWRTSTVRLIIDINMSKVQLCACFISCDAFAFCLWILHDDGSVDQDLRIELALQRHVTYRPYVRTGPTITKSSEKRTLADSDILCMLGIARITRLRWPWLELSNDFRGQDRAAWRWIVHGHERWSRLRVRVSLCRSARCRKWQQSIFSSQLSITMVWDTHPCSAVSHVAELRAHLEDSFEHKVQ